METEKNTIQTTLTELGLNENEAKLYKILLENPDATIPLLTQKSPFTRTMLYYIVESLSGYDLVITEKRGKKTTYNAAPPEKLEKLFEDQEKEIRRQKEALGQVIGDLRSVYNLSHNKPGVKFYEGPEGIREVTFDSLKATETIYTFADIEAVDRYAKEMNAAYVREHLAKKIPKKLIALDTPYTRERYRAAPPAVKLLEVRLLPASLSPFKTGMQIYNNTISYSTLTAEKQIGVIILDEYIARMHRSLFEYVWNSLPALPAVAATPPQPTAPKATNL